MNPENLGKNSAIGEQIQKGIANDKAKRFDFGKLRWDLLPYDVLEKVVEVFTHGSVKYDDNNWRQGMKYSRMYGSILRHLTKSIRGEDIDSDSGCLHLAQAAWGCLCLSWFLKHNIGEDDRQIDLIDETLQCKNDISKQKEMFNLKLNELLQKQLEKEKP